MIRNFILKLEKCQQRITPQNNEIRLLTEARQVKVADQDPLQSTAYSF